MQQILLILSATMLTLNYPIANTLAVLTLGLACVISGFFMVVPIPGWLYAQNYHVFRLSKFAAFCFLYALVMYIYHLDAAGAFLVIACWAEAAVTDYVASRAYDDWEGNFVWYNPKASKTFQKVILHVEDDMDLSSRGYTLIHFSDLPRNP